jgi:large subunit ribosomal protein L32e
LVDEEKAERIEDEEGKREENEDNATMELVRESSDGGKAPQDEKGPDDEVPEKIEESDVESKEDDVEIEDVKEEKKARKVKKKEKRKKIGRTRRKGEKVEIVEELPIIKPKISDEIKELLELRRELKSKKPDFRRQEWFRYDKLGLKWRRPRGMHSKMRRHYKRRINVVSIGYGSPTSIRYYHPSGFREKLVHNVDGLEGVDPKTYAVRIGHSVGSKKRLAIIERADEDGIRVLNRGITVEEIEEETKDEKKTTKSGGK